MREPGFVESIDPGSNVAKIGQVSVGDVPVGYDYSGVVLKEARHRF